MILDPVDGPELRLSLRGASDMNLQKVSVRLIPTSIPGQEGLCIQKELRRGLQAERAYGDQFLMKNVPYPAGQYILLLLPEPPESWFTPLEIDIALPSYGFAEVSLYVVPGGRLGGVDGGGGRATVVLEGDYVLRNSLGAEVYSSRQGHAAESPEPEGRSEAASIRRSTRIVPAGTYEIEATSEGFRTVHEAVTVRAGQEERKLIRLERDKD